MRAGSAAVLPLAVVLTIGYADDATLGVGQCCQKVLQDTAFQHADRSVCGGWVA